MITILGPTASGKTSLAAHLASGIGGEIISADSRQVYRGMNIGTGKDYDEYTVNGVAIPVHLIDIADPGSEYNVFEFQHDFLETYKDITGRRKIPVLCGGSGMYLESVLKGYRLPPVDISQDRSQSLEKLSDEELIRMLRKYRTPHNSTDLTDRKRLIRAVEIGLSGLATSGNEGWIPPQNPLILGLKHEREALRQRITGRLNSRLEHGLVEEVRALLDRGLTADQLKFYGLEYRYVTMYINGEMNYKTMVERLNISIHQFAKRQMTWFRRMERNGLVIHWIDGSLGTPEKIARARGLIGI
jgi:tRNA dimethylallyltransferase